MNTYKINDNLDWLKEKLKLNSLVKNAEARFVKRGQVYLCHLGIGIGAEMQNTRPCVILQNDRANYFAGNTVVAPFTHKEKDLPTIVAIDPVHDEKGEEMLSGAVNLTQVRVISKARLGDHIATLDKGTMAKIDAALARELDLMSYYNDLHKKYENLKKQLDTLKGAPHTREHS